MIIQEEDLPKIPFQVAYREDLDWRLVVLITEVIGSDWFEGTVLVTPDTSYWKVGYKNSGWLNDTERMRIL